MAKKPPSKGDSRSNRQMHVRVKTARGRKKSSTQWLQRQLNDPYVLKAKEEGYRSRATYKLVELDEKFSLLKPGMTVVDLGAAPGGWTQVALQKVGKNGRVIALDINPFDEIPGAIMLEQDFMAEEAPDVIIEALEGRKADLVMSDMAAPSCGHAPTDHLRIMALCEAALDFALDVTAPGGHFVAKVLKGGSEKSLLDLMKKHYTTVKHAKPPASRSDSAEAYVVAMGFKS